MIQKFDFLVIGGGIAGMSYALSVAKSGKGKVALVCKTTLDEANTAKAQGGVAAVLNELAAQSGTGLPLRGPAARAPPPPAPTPPRRL